MTHVCPAAFGWLKNHARAFRDEERGSATLWNVTWLLVFAGMAGLSIDSSNGYRHKSLLQSTADAAALAGAWHLPESYLDEPYVAGSYADVEDAALWYAEANMSGSQFGQYFSRNDILVGYWDAANRQFIPGDVFPTPDYAPVNAVRVDMASVNARNNGLPTSILHMAGIDAWDVRTAATAVYGVPGCLKNGIIAREGVDIASNAKILKNVCVHGQLFANVNNNVYWNNPESLSTGRSPQGEWEVSPGQYDADGRPVDLSDPNYQNLYPPMVDRIPTIGRGMLRGDLHYRHFLYPPMDAPADPDNPDQPTVIALPKNFEHITGTTITTASWLPPDNGVRLASLGGFGNIGALMGLASTGDASADGRTTTYAEVVKRGSRYLWPLDEPVIDPATDGFTTTTEGAPTGVIADLDEDRVYFADTCHPPSDGHAEQYITLSGVIRNITLVTNCKIVIQKAAADGTPTRVENAVLLSTAASGGGKAVFVENGVQLGANTACENWGGIRIYGNGDFQVPSSGSGFSQWFGAHVVARADIHLAGQNYSAKGLSLMAGGDVKIEGNATIGALDGSLDETYPVGGCPDDGVKQEHGQDAYLPALVD